MSKKILFINHNAERCGVADYGRRLFNILKDHLDITMSDSEQEGYDIILYNYHYATLPNVRKMNVPQIALFHEAHLNFQFDKVVNVADLPRPLFENINFLDKENDGSPITGSPPIIGSFGYGFPDKDFPGICQIVKAQYKYAGVCLNIPFAQFGDNDGSLARAEADKCREILKGTEIILEITHDHKSHNDLLFWLSLNDINLFLYKPSHGRGISSTIDYALSVKRPIGISNSEMFRHLPREIVVDNISIPDLIKKGIEPLKQVYEDNSNEKLVAKIKEILL
jgi:hypothetical protein